MRKEQKKIGMISLVVPIYNMKMFLPRCMDGLLSQKNDYEIILVDDGSTDGSAELCDRYALEFPNLVRVIHKVNGGLSSARNAGIEAAQGRYVVFPDPDDWVEPDYVERLAELQNQYQPDLLCVGHYIDYDTRSIQANSGHALRQMDGKAAQRSLLIPPCMNGFAWNKLYHLNVIKEHGLFFLDDVGTTEDLDFAYRYLKYCETVCFDPESRLYHYYQRNGAATHSGFSQKKLDSIHTYEKMIESSTDQEMIRAAEEEICNSAVNLVWNYQNSKTKDKEVEVLLQQYIRKYLKQYCKSGRFDKGRKTQAVLACYMPKLYVRLKNYVGKKYKDENYDCGSNCNI